MKNYKIWGKDLSFFLISILLADIRHSMSVISYTANYFRAGSITYVRVY